MLLQMTIDNKFLKELSLLSMLIQVFIRKLISRKFKFIFDGHNAFEKLSLPYYIMNCKKSMNSYCIGIKYLR